MSKFGAALTAFVSIWSAVGCSSNFQASVSKSLPSSVTGRKNASSVSPFYTGKMKFLSSSAARVAAKGSLEVVYDADTQACAGVDMDIPDTPVQAYHDASGNVVINISHFTGNYRNVGPDLDNVEHVCQASLVSANDTKFSDDLYHQWISSPYTLDGTHVISLVHNEWYPTTVKSSCTAGWANSIDFVTSSDGGATFQVPDDYKVRHPGSGWKNSFDCQDDDGETVYGSFLPSGIVDGHDGYYYSFFRQIAAPGGTGPTDNTCLMRSANLSGASDWNVWTGSDWQPANSTTDMSCGVIPFPGMQTFPGWFSVKYSTYFNQYIALLDGPAENDSDRLHYALSSDLIHWSTAVPLAAELQVGDAASLPQYFSLLDPTDTSMNFDNVGQDPYIYFVIFGAGNLDRQVVRQQIHFAPAVNATTSTATVTGSTSSSSTASSASGTLTASSSSTNTNGATAASSSSTGSSQTSTTSVSSSSSDSDAQAQADAQAAAETAAQAAAQSAANAVQAQLQAEQAAEAAAQAAAAQAAAAVQAAAEQSAAAAQAAAAQAIAARQSQVVYRYVSDVGFHVYALNSSNIGISTAYGLEGAVFSTYLANYTSTSVLMRCRVNGYQFLSTDPACEGQVVGEQIGFISTIQLASTVPLYRMVDGNGDHLEVLDPSEGTNAGYSVEGVLGFVPAN